MKVIENLKNKVNKNTNLIKRGRWINLSFIFGVNEKEFIFKIVDGKINSITQKKVDTEFGIFKISSSLENWEKHWLKIPPRDFHDLFAMLSKKIIKLDGDLKPLMQNLQYFKDLIASAEILPPFEIVSFVLTAKVDAETKVLPELSSIT